MTLLEAARQALPGLVWHFDGFDMVWAYPKGGVGWMGINGRHPHYHAYLRDKTAHHSSREAAAQWLRAQVESRRAALDAALGDSQWARVAELEKAVAQWVGMRGVAAARADAAEAKLKALAAESRERWIPVTERLPEQWQDVLVAWDGTVLTAYMNAAGTWCERYGERPIAVTLWRPLPAPPEQ